MKEGEICENTHFFATAAAAVKVFDCYIRYRPGSYTHIFYSPAGKGHPQMAYMIKLVGEKWESFF